MTSKESSIYQNYESHSNKWGIFLCYESSGYSQLKQGTYLIRLNYNHILFISIAILVNNAFKTVQQSAKDKKDICRRADARQRYLTQDFTL